jgi:hypothetical protein
VLTIYGELLFANPELASSSPNSYMMHSRTQLDIHALVCILEMVTTRLLASLRPDLHGLIIPKSWIFSLAQHRTWSSPPKQSWIFSLAQLRPWSSLPNLDYLPLFVDSLITLVQNIEGGAGV